MSKSTVERLIELAEAEVGYLEKASNSQLDDKTANAGHNNYTKYARDLDAAGYYGFSTISYPWCDAFVDWLFYMLCGKDRAHAIHVTCQTGTGAALCATSLQGFKNAGRFYKSPKPGDQIFFYKSDMVTIGHTGLVYKVDSSKVYTIEGNTSSTAGVIANGGGVFKKSYSLSYARIVGYGRPRFEEINSAQEPTLIPTFGLLLAELLPTKTTLQIKYPEDIIKNDYTLSYRLTNLATNELETDTYNKLIDTLALKNLIPCSPYLIKLTFKHELYTVDRQIFFATPQEYPEAIQDLRVSFKEGTLLNSTCEIHFKTSSDTWGEYGKTNRRKGYRCYLFVNGKAQAYSDNFLSSNNATGVSKKFLIKDLLQASDTVMYDDSRVQYTDSIQIGIQTFVKDATGKIVLSNDLPVCSKPLYFKHIFTVIDKIFLNSDNIFKRAVLYTDN